jgi:hypothetical protein
MIPSRYEGRTVAQKLLCHSNIVNPESLPGKVTMVHTMTLPKENRQLACRLHSQLRSWLERVEFCQSLFLLFLAR